jgi:hypothetical protein
MDLGLLDLSGPMNSVISDTQKSVLHVDTLSQSPMKIPPPSSPVHKISLNYDTEEEQDTAEGLLAVNLEFTNNTHTHDEQSIPFVSEGDIPTQTQNRWEDTQVAAAVDPKLPHLGLEDEDVQQLEQQILKLQEKEEHAVLTSDHRGPLDDIEDPLTDGLLDKESSMMDISVEIVSEISKLPALVPEMPILIVSQESAPPATSDTNAKEAVPATQGEAEEGAIALEKLEPVQDLPVDVEDPSMLFEEQESKDELLQLENGLVSENLFADGVDSSQEIVGSRSVVPISESDSEDNVEKEGPASPNLMEVTKLSDQPQCNPFLSVPNAQIVSDSQGGVAYDPSPNEPLETDPLCSEQHLPMEISKRSLEQVEWDDNEENRHPNLPVSPSASTKSQESKRPVKRHRPTFTGNDAESSSTEPDNSNDDDYQPTQKNARLFVGKSKGSKVSRTPKTTPKPKTKKNSKRFYWIRVPEKEYMIPYELPDGVLDIDLG